MEGKGRHQTLHATFPDACQFRAALNSAISLVDPDVCGLREPA